MSVDFYMKVLLVAKPWSGGLAKYLYHSLNDVMPDQVTWIATYPDNLRDRYFYSKDKSAWLNQLVDKINHTEYDVAVFVNHLKVFNRLRADRKHVCWLTDAPKVKLGECDAFQRIYLSDIGYESDLLANINKAQYFGELPFACYPKIHYPSLVVRQKMKDVCFVGNKDPLRDKRLNHLLKQGFNLSVYGNYFLRTSLFLRYPQHFYPAVANEKMQEVYSKHKVSMNFHAKVVRHGTNMRTFECAAYGIPQVVDYRPGLSNFFSKNAIAIAGNDEQISESVNLILKNPSIARTMAAHARSEVLSKHTYYHRILQALQGWLTPEIEYRLLRAVRVGVLG